MATEQVKASESVIDATSVGEALKDWHSVEKLGDCSLAHLKQVDARRQALGYENTAQGRGWALRDVLLKAINQFPHPEPDEHVLEVDQAWRSYYVLYERYIEDYSIEFIIGHLDVSRRTFYDIHKKAIHTLVDRLHQNEATLTSTYATPSQTRPLVAIEKTIAAIQALQPQTKIRTLFGALAALAFLIFIILPIATAALAPPTFLNTICNLSRILPVTLSACASSAEPTVRVIVVPFDLKPDVPEDFLTERIYDQLLRQLDADIERGYLSIAKAPKPAANKLEAQAIGQNEGATLVIWGRVDPYLSEVGFEIIAEKLPKYDQESPPIFRNPRSHHRQLNDLSFAEYQSFEAQSSELEARISFMTTFMLSQIRYLSQEYPLASSQLTAALEAIPQPLPEYWDSQNIARAYFFSGFLHEVNQSWEAAILAYDQAVSVDPSLHEAILHRAFVHSALGDINKAMDDYTRLINEDSPLSGIAYANRACMQPTRQAMERDFEQAVQEAPLDGHIQRGLKHLLVWNNPEGAVADFKAALQYDTVNPYRYHDLSVAQLLSGQTFDALETYRRAVDYLTPEAIEFMQQDLAALRDQHSYLHAELDEMIAILQRHN